MGCCPVSATEIRRGRWCVSSLVEPLSWRDVVNKLAGWWLGLLLLSGAALAAEEGFDYQLVTPPVATQSPGRVEVVEMFWYGCPHCFHFEPIVNAWLAKQPANVNFVRVPAVFRDSWEPLGRAFYVAETLGILEKMHPILFQAVQVQRRRLESETDLRAFFAESGVSSADFDRVYHSFGVDAKIRRARDLSQRYGIDGVPSVIINGKYRSNGTLVGGLEKLPGIMDKLVAKESGH